MEYRACFERKSSHLNLPKERQSILYFSRFFEREDILRRGAVIAPKTIKGLGDPAPTIKKTRRGFFVAIGESTMSKKYF
jgi:hypothetical protein